MSLFFVWALERSLDCRAFPLFSFKLIVNDQVRLSLDDCLT